MDDSSQLMSCKRLHKNNRYSGCAVEDTLPQEAGGSEVTLDRKGI